MNRDLSEWQKEFISGFSEKQAESILELINAINNLKEIVSSLYLTSDKTNESDGNNYICSRCSNHVTDQLGGVSHKQAIAKHGRQSINL